MSTGSQGRSSACNLRSPGRFWVYPGPVRPEFIRWRRGGRRQVRPVPRRPDFVPSAWPLFLLAAWDMIVLTGLIICAILRKETP
jgi:hypothetical protein